MASKCLQKVTILLKFILVLLESRNMGYFQANTYNSRVVIYNRNVLYMTDH